MIFLGGSHVMKNDLYAMHVHVRRYNKQNSCCYMLSILFGDGIVVCLAINGYDKK